MTQEIRVIYIRINNNKDSTHTPHTLCSCLEMTDMVIIINLDKLMERIKNPKYFGSFD